MFRLLAFAAALALCVPLAAGDPPATAPEGVKVDPELPVYAPLPLGVLTGDIKSIGSDSMNNLMTFWAEGFQAHFPSVRVAIEGRASGAGGPRYPPGFFFPMSRPMRPAETEEFERQNGSKPTGFVVALDALAVFVHKDNPLASLSLPQVDAIFSKTRKLGAPADLRAWGELGLTSEWAKQPIRLHGRNSAAGTYGYFKERALGKGDFKDTVKEHPGTSSVVSAVAADKFALGYGGIAYATPEVRAVPLSSDDKAKPVPATPESAYANTYPFVRSMYVYVNHKPGTEWDPLRREFLRFVFSRQGQEVVVKDGCFPVKAEDAREALASAGIER